MTKTNTLIRKIAVSLLLLGLITGAFFLLLGDDRVPVTYKDGIPLPFGSSQNQELRGRIDTIGQKNGIPLRYLSFTNNETSEVLRDAVVLDSIDFAITPDDPSISDGAPLCKAVTAGKAFFGYEYTSATAQDEREQSALMENGANIPFSRLFAGTFFASSQERGRDSSITDFEELHDVVFIDPCDTMKLKKNTRYVIVVNDTDTTLTVRGIEWCGNGTLEIDEQCDDGNTDNADDCTNLCTLPGCGDGITSGTEECDDGNTNNSDACTNQCTFPQCGNGIVEGTEQCDDANTDNADDCTNQCTSARCGDGIKSSVEQCDDGNTNDSDDCTNLCTFPELCGDGIQQPNGGDGIPGTDDDEQCDDGNTIDDDICDNSCKLVSPFTSSSQGSSMSGPPL